MSSNQHDFETRREAKWQFRRRLLLAAASILENDTTGESWEKVRASLSHRKNNPDTVIRQTAANWENCGSTPETMIKNIREKYQKDTPEGPERHRLQDISEGHPFASMIPEETRSELYNLAYGTIPPNRKMDDTPPI